MLLQRFLVNELLYSHFDTKQTLRAAPLHGCYPLPAVLARCASLLRRRCVRLRGEWQHS